MLLYHTVFKGVVMVVEKEIALPSSRYSSVEEVFNVWRKRLGSAWVEEVRALPEIEQKVNAFAHSTQRSLPDAWASYLSGIMLSQI
jgi:hypothetical protein